MVETIELGAGDRVVFVHGDVFGAEMTWSEQKPLADGYRLVLVNRRGFGNSPDPEGGGEDFEVDAADVIDLIGAEPVHLVGHSYGGVVSLIAAGRRPDLIRSLAVFEPPAFGLVDDRPDVQEFIARVHALLADDPSPDDYLPQFVRLVGGDPSRLPSPLPPPLVRAATVQIKGRWPMEAVIPLDALAAAPFPKLVVSGGHSALFDSVCDVLEARLPARREVIPGAGHTVPRVGEPVNRTLAEFWSTA